MKKLVESKLKLLSVLVLTGLIMGAALTPTVFVAAQSGENGEQGNGNSFNAEQNFSLEETPRPGVFLSIQSVARK